MKIRIEMIFAKNFARNYEKKDNTWNIRHLVDESFVTATQRIILKITIFLLLDIFQKKSKAYSSSFQILIHYHRLSQSTHSFTGLVPEVSHFCNHIEFTQ